MTIRVYFHKRPIVQAQSVDGAVLVFKQLLRTFRPQQKQRRCDISWQLYGL